MQKFDYTQLSDALSGRFLAPNLFLKNNLKRISLFREIDYTTNLTTPSTSRQTTYFTNSPDALFGEFLARNQFQTFHLLKRKIEGQFKRKIKGQR